VSETTIHDTSASSSIPFQVIKICRLCLHREVPTSICSRAERCRLRYRYTVGVISSSQALLQKDTVTFEAVLKEVQCITITELQCTIFLDTCISSCNYPSSRAAANYIVASPWRSRGSYWHHGGSPSHHSIWLTMAP
jgi:hypothetical protein